MKRFFIALCALVLISGWVMLTAYYDGAVVAGQFQAGAKIGRNLFAVTRH